MPRADEVFVAEAYRINTGRGGKPVEEILRTVAALPRKPWIETSASNLWAYVDGYNVSLDRLTVYERAAAGTIYSARVLGLDDVASYKGEQAGRIGDDEGQARHVAFLYDLDRKVLWMQRDFRSVGAQTFGRYLNEKFDFPIYISPIYDDEAIARALKKKLVKTITLSLRQTPDAANAIDGVCDEVDDMLGMRKSYGAVYIDITLRSEAGLATKAKKLLKGINSLLTNEDQRKHVSKAHVGISDDAPGAQIEDLNLVRERFEFRQQMTATKFGQPTALMSALRLLWKENRDKVPTQ